MRLERAFFGNRFCGIRITERLFVNSHRDEQKRINEFVCVFERKKVCVCVFEGKCVSVCLGVSEGKRECVCERASVQFFLSL